MNAFLEKIKQATLGDIINFSCFIVSVVLGAIAFFIPPKGVIDQSVLLFIAEVGVFSTLSRVPDFIKSVASNHTNLEIKKGETSIKIGDDDKRI